jgi:cell division transport system permease protein
MRRLGYLLREAWANIRLNRTTSLVAVVTTGFTLACLGVFLLIYLNVRGMAASLASEIKVIVFLQENLSDSQLAELRQQLEREQAVAALSFVSKDQALADFREQFPSDFELLEGLGENPLPASFAVTLAPRFRSPEFVRRWAEQFKALPGVAQVEYSQDWVENLTGLLRNLEGLALSVGLILSVASVTIIGSTIRLTLHARRDEVQILRLVGASGSFLRLPYLIEGAMLGGAGSLLALGILKSGFELFRLKLGAASQLLGAQPWLSYFPGHVKGVLIVAGVILGGVGSFLSIMRMREASSL